MNYSILDNVIKSAFEEDFPYGDITTEALIPPDQRMEAKLIAKEEGIIAGLGVFQRVYSLLEGVDCHFLCTDGHRVHKGEIIGTLSGDGRNMLKGERTALNFIQRLSGIASLTNQYAAILSGSKTKLLDTRKTTPGLRYLEKYAVTVGGGVNHRFGLSDGVLIKDNHIKAVGGIIPAVAMARKQYGFVRKIEVETENLQMVREALEAKADIIMLDNMGDEAMREAVSIIGGQALTECSGNVDLIRLKTLRDIGVDYVSCGALTHSYSSLDLSLRISG